MITVETILGIVGGGMENGWGINSCMIYLIHCNNLCKCHNVPLPITTIKKKKTYKAKPVAHVSNPTYLGG
jgi:hypothetical protein